MRNWQMYVRGGSYVTTAPWTKSDLGTGGLDLSESWLPRFYLGFRCRRGF